MQFTPLIFTHKKMPVEKPIFYKMIRHLNFQKAPIKSKLESKLYIKHFSSNLAGFYCLKAAVDYYFWD